MRNDVLFPVDELEKMRSVYDMLCHTRDHYGARTAYRQIEVDGSELSLSFSEFADQIEALRAVFMEIGFKGKHFAIIGETCFQWIAAYLAVISGIGICVPIDKELSDDSIVYQLNHAEVDVLIVSVKNYHRIKNLLPQCQRIKEIIVMRGASEEIQDAGKGCTVTSYNDLTCKGKRIVQEKGLSAFPEEIPLDDPCVIIFTSGTTGANKGVVLSNKNIVATLKGCGRVLRYPETDFSVLPVNHSYELHANLMSAMYCGSCVCINDEMRYLLRNLKKFKPEMSCMVPMMLDSIVRQIKKEIKRSGKEAAFNRLLKVSNSLRKIGIDRRRKFFKTVLDSLGGNLKMIICGGAFLDRDTEAFLTSIGVDVYNGYGITECSPVAAVNTFKLVKPGSAGRILPTADIRIADQDENGNGEIQIHGDLVMKGYYQSEEDTKQVFTEDGWLRTGDLGYVDEDQFLYITGRIKNLIILPNGKNIYPEELEKVLMKKTPLIKECVIKENAAQTGLYAYIYPDMDVCAKDASAEPEALKRYFKPLINAFNLGEPSYKRLSDFEIRMTPFEKNTTHKILRYKVGKPE